jgi:hypothetical protein
VGRLQEVVVAEADYNKHQRNFEVHRLQNFVDEAEVVVEDIEIQEDQEAVGTDYNLAAAAVAVEQVVVVVAAADKALTVVMLEQIVARLVTAAEKALVMGTPSFGGAMVAKN